LTERWKALAATRFLITSQFSLSLPPCLRPRKTLSSSQLSEVREPEEECSTRPNRIQIWPEIKLCCAVLEWRAVWR